MVSSLFFAVTLIGINVPLLVTGVVVTVLVDPIAWTADIVVY